MNILLYAPGGRNGTVLERRLRRAGISGQLCTSEKEFISRLKKGADIVLVTQRAWTSHVSEAFELFRKRQASWSSPPLLLLTEADELHPGISSAYCIKKPVPFATLLSAVQLALKTREQQLEVGKLLSRLETYALTLEDKVTAQGASLRASERRFEQVFRASPTPTALIEKLSGTFVDVNPSFLALTDYELDAIIGHSPERLNMIIDKRPWKTIFAEGVSGEKRFEMRLRTRTGEARYCLLNAELMETGESDCLLVTLVDISEQKRGEAHLLRAVNEVMEDASWFSRAVVDRVNQLKGETVAHLPAPDLTRREEQVLGLIGQGLATKDIASKLDLSPNTIRNYTKNLYAKIGVSSRAEAVIWARERGISFLDA